MEETLKEPLQEVITYLFNMGKILIECYIDEELDMVEVDFLKEETKKYLERKNSLELQRIEREQEHRYRQERDRMIFERQMTRARIPSPSILI